MMLPLKYNIRSLWVRKVGSFMTLLGLAVTVGVFVSLMALAMSLQRALVNTGSDRNVLALRAGALAEPNSAITREQFGVLKYLPEVMRNSKNQPLASAELCLPVFLPRGRSLSGSVLLRGVEPIAFEVHEQVRLVPGGRMFRSQASECIIGAGVAKRYAYAASVGKKIKFGSREWEVVGVFEAGGSGFESEIWTDVKDLMGDYKRVNFSSVTFQLVQASQFSAVEAFLAEDPRMGLRAEVETRYYERQSNGMMQMKGLTIIITALMAVGAVFAAMNTMYAAVAGRTREIAAMRAVGFSQRQILGSFVMESVLLALVGGVLGCLLAWPLEGLSSGSMNFRSFTETSFSLHLTFPLIMGGIGFSALMGLLGGFFPAWQASRLPIIRALREQ